MSHLKNLLKRISEETKQDYPFPDDLELFLNKFIPSKFLKNETFQKTFKITDSELELIYKEGYEQYIQQIYDDSIKTFRWLVFLNPYISKFWFALAGSLQMKQEYEKALHAYSVTALLRSKDPYPHYYAFTCYLKLNNYEDAYKALDLAFLYSQNNPIYIELLQEISSYKNTLKEK